MKRNKVDQGLFGAMALFLILGLGLPIAEVRGQGSEQPGGVQVAPPATDIPVNPVQFLVPGENLADFKRRMDAYFTPQIATRGLAALVEEEGSDYNHYLQFLRTWEPRLSPHGDLREYFKLEKNHFEPGGLGPVPVAQNDIDGGIALFVNRLGQPRTWREVGPTSKPAGSSSAAGIGPVEFITFFGPDPKHMLCGSVAGGLFVSNNSGNTWTNAGTDTQIGRTGVGTAVYHPSDAKTFFAASAGNAGDNQAGYIGYTGGVFRTTNQGASWSKIGGETNLGGIWTRIVKLAINPANPQQLWAATTSGLFVTVNALDSSPVWTAVSALSGKYLYDFEIRPGDANWLYATAAVLQGQSLMNWRFLYSKDNGSTWLDVPGQPLTTYAASRLTIEVSPAKADNLYALIQIPDFIAQGQELRRSELHVYDFGRNTWKGVIGSANITMGGGHSFGVDPVDPNEIFLSEGIKGRRYYRSASGDSLYTPFNTGYHDDIEDLVPHPSKVNEVWMAHHGGISVSIDNGVTWADRSQGLGVALPMMMAAGASDPGYVALGLYHDGTVLTTPPWSDYWSPIWRTVTGGDGLRPLIDPTTSQFIWTSHQFGGWNRSTDFGATFSGNGPVSPTWISEATFNRVNPATQFRIVTAQGFHNVSRTTDRGNTWIPISKFESTYPNTAYEYLLWKVYSPETSGDYLLVHVLERPRNSGLWWRHRLYRTKIANNPSAANVISSWQELPLPVDLWLSDVDFDPANPDVVYLTNGSSSASSANAIGKDMVLRVDYTQPQQHTYKVCKASLCRDLTLNLPNANTGTDGLAIDKSGNGDLYIATDFGVYFSTEVSRAPGGSGWRLLGRGLPRTNFNGIEINYVNRKLRVASFGRGLWETDLPPACTVVPVFPGLWLPFDEATGPTALNGGVGSSPGTHFGGPTPTAAGKVAGGLCFDGQDDYVDVPFYVATNFGVNNFSLAAWVKRGATSGGIEVLIDKRAPDSNQKIRGYSLFLSNERIGLQLADGTFDNYLSQNPFPADGLWHHVAVTVERRRTNGGRFYLDGKPFGPAFDPTAHRGTLASAAKFRVGAGSPLPGTGNASGFLRGCLDEVMAIDRLLSPEDVLVLFEAGANGKCKSTCTLPEPQACDGGVTPVTAEARVCNLRQVSQTFNYSFQGLGVQSGCSLPGPTSFTPVSGTVTVPAGTCQAVPTSMSLPTVLGRNDTSCLEVSFQSGVAPEVLRCAASIIRLCPCNPPFCGPF